MAIVPGVWFGPYQIVGLIGAGGMGEVYKATDTRLQRTVAIKVLPELFSKDEERLARFEREARTLASLNHPNIAQIYGLEDARTGGRESRALAMEFVEGEDLAERLSRGSMPLDDALAIARQIVDALEAAHEHGVMHRDLKPANIKVRPDGTVKVLDFGLAKALDPPGELPGGIPATPTVTNIHTHVGVLLGTAGYMAPEQAKGRTVDRRGDIWAFGVVLYELLTGVAPFTGASTSEILAQVIEREPDWSRVPATTPLSIVRLLQRCLQKDPRRRLQAIGDARFDMEEALIAPSTSVAAKASLSRSRLMGGLALAGLVCSAVLGVLLFRARTTESHTARLSAAIPLPEGRYLDGFGPPALAVSKDGRTLAFLARGASGLQHLYVRPLNDARATLVPDSETGEGPFFSPDGRWVAFAVGTSGLSAARPELRKYSLDTGLTQTVAPIEDYFGGTWTKDDNLIFVGAQPRGLWKVPAGGGTPQNVVPTVRFGGEDVDRGLAWPDLLPGERSVLVSDWDSRQVAMVNLDNREMVHLGLEGAGPRFAPNGYVVYALNTELRAIAFNPSTGRVTGAPVALLQDIAYGRNTAPVFAFSDEGTLVFATGYLRGSRREPMRILRATRQEKPVPLAIQPQLIGRGFVLSPDGSRLAINSWGSPAPVLIDLRRSTTVTLEDTGLTEVSSLAWTTDGRQLAVSGPVTGRGLWGAFLKNVNGSGKPQPLVEPEKIEIHLAGWTPDGQTLMAFGGRPVQVKMEIMRLQRGKPREVIHTEPGAISSARISPDGRWLAYDSTATGAFEVYVLPVSGHGDRVPVTAAGGMAPLWSPDGRELLFRRDNAVMSVTFKTVGTNIEFGGERKLFEWDTAREWGIAPNGDIYGAEPVPGAALQTTIQLKTGWFAELDRLIR
jgi:eukaryotic-like serine/threonine-protein kinase